MDSISTYIWIAVAVVAVLIAIAGVRNPKILKKAAGSAAAGLAALGVVNLTAGLTGVGIAVSGWSLAVAGVLGLPGVIGMLLIKAFWGI